MLNNITPYAERHLVATSTTATQYAWYTDWLLAVGVDSIRAVIKIFNSGGNLSCQLAIQTAAVRQDKPGSPTAITGGPYTSAETCTGNLSVSASTGSAMWFRLGIAYVGGAAGVCQGDVGLEASWNQYGWLVDSRSDVQLSSNSTGQQILVLTRWVPSIAVSSFKVAFSANSLVAASSPDIEMMLITQYANTSIEDPSAWNTGFESARSWTGVYELCTADLSYAATGAMWVRFGLAYAATGTTENTGTFSATIAART